MTSSNSSGESLDTAISRNPPLCGILEPVDEASETSMSTYGPENELGRMLSMSSVTTTTSSTAILHDDDAQSHGSEEFKKIGAGACGVAKAGYHFDLWNDYGQHQTIRQAFEKFAADDHHFKIPALHGYVPADEDEYLFKHPDLVQAASNECHMPADMDKFCAQRNKEAALADVANKDCLVRLYLGPMRGRSGGMFFSLRNFKQHLNLMVELIMDVETAAHKMGGAMAILHWAAGTNARDVEFVLGSSAKKLCKCVPVPEARRNTRHYVGPASCAHREFFTRTTEFWDFDFNQVKRISFDEDGVAEAVNAAKINDPYIPRLYGNSAVEKRTWNTFAKSYVEMSNRVRRESAFCDDEAVLQLPGKFLKGLQDVYR
ncbi:hypothetical protein XA68_12364 [Ophiocordyceps unilateralis]|uniref:DUF3669 domain-containing protein n=1 Tax=Ophiocordyceps unilateralis TaxID=268505 RepID=A0A2A9PUV8_OPHUN|nr:hypothetical protein XA68_12364 [Ophiocordyceps unilateralis]